MLYLFGWLHMAHETWWWVELLLTLMLLGLWLEASWAIRFGLAIYLHFVDC